MYVLRGSLRFSEDAVEGEDAVEDGDAVKGEEAVGDGDAVEDQGAVEEDEQRRR